MKAGAAFGHLNSLSIPEHKRNEPGHVHLDPLCSVIYVYFDIARH